MKSQHGNKTISDDMKCAVNMRQHLVRERKKANKRNQLNDNGQTTETISIVALNAIMNLHRNWVNMLKG